jgi:hypothetical protein
MSMSVIERMARIHSVAWSRLPSGQYYVEWTQDGVREFRTFRTAGAAEGLVRWLDTTGQAASAAEVRIAERALRDLEQTVEQVERHEAEGALEDLETTMTELGYRRGAVPVKRYRRK